MDSASWSQAQRLPQVCAAWTHGRASSSVRPAGPAATSPRAGLAAEVEILVTCGDARGRQGGPASAFPSEKPTSPGREPKPTDGRTDGTWSSQTPQATPLAQCKVGGHCPKALRGHWVLASPFVRSLRTETLPVALLGTAGHRWAPLTRACE